MIDVLIVGAGPAGNQAADMLSRLGHSVLVLDCRQRIGDKLCTGIVSRECAEQYGVPEHLIHRPAKGSWVVPPGGNRLFFQRPETQAYVIDRVGFVEELANRAKRRGAEYLLERRVVDLSFTPDGVAAIARNGDRLETYEARAAIVATGFASSAGRRLGLESPRKAAFAAQVALAGVDVDELCVYAGRWVPAGFFGWLVPTTPGNALAGVLGRGRPAKPLAALLRGISGDGIRIDSVGRRRAWGVPLRPSTTSVSDRCLLVGDAAGQVKPTTGGGIFYALRCGDIAAEVMSECLGSGDLSKEALLPYEHRWKSEFGRELRLGYLARLVYERLGARELDMILGIASTSGILDDDVSFDHHSELVVRAVKSRLFGTFLDSIPMIGAPAGGDS